jgi:hypothetical protein
MNAPVAWPQAELERILASAPQVRGSAVAFQQGGADSRTCKVANLAQYVLSKVQSGRTVMQSDSATEFYRPYDLSVGDFWTALTEKIGVLRSNCLKIVPASPNAGTAGSRGALRARAPCLPVRARPGWPSTLIFPTVTWLSMVPLHGYAGRLAAKKRRFPARAASGAGYCSSRTTAAAADAGRAAALQPPTPRNGPLLNMTAAWERG